MTLQLMHFQHGYTRQPISMLCEPGFETFGYSFHDIDGTLAIADGAAFPLESIKPYFIEMKTGFDPKFTSNQEDVYRLICLGGHAVSLDDRIRQLELIPGVPLPPLDIMVVRTFGPGLSLKFHNYCEDFLE